MEGRTAIVLGATGLTGSLLVSQLINDSYFSSVKVLVRSSFPPHPKLQIIKTDFSDKEEYKRNIGTGDVIFCCIGTSMKKVNNDRNLYRQIDFEIAADAAGFGKDAGVTQYVLISAIGANKNSGIFYSRLKGETEEAVISKGFESTHIFRPSILYGDRKEKRFAESIGKAVMTILSPIMAGPLKKYRGIEGEALAHAMIYVVKQHKTGVFYYDYSDIMASQ